VSSLWTPSGEHPTGGEDAPLAPEELSPEELEEAAGELARARAELAAVPVVDIIVNHAIGIWQLAALHLTPDPLPDGSPQAPRLAEAGLAIDAFAAIVEGLGERLAPHDEAMVDALTQLRLAFVQVAERSGG